MNVLDELKAVLAEANAHGRSDTWYICGNAFGPHRCIAQCAAINKADGVNRETAERWWQDNAEIRSRYETLES